VHVPSSYFRRTSCRRQFSVSGISFFIILFLPRSAASSIQSVANYTKKNFIINIMRAVTRRQQAPETRSFCFLFFSFFVLLGSHFRLRPSQNYRNFDFSFYLFMQIQFNCKLTLKYCKNSENFIETYFKMFRFLRIFLTRLVNDDNYGGSIYCREIESRYIFTSCASFYEYTTAIRPIQNEYKLTHSANKKLTCFPIVASHAVGTTDTTFLTLKIITEKVILIYC